MITVVFGGNSFQCSIALKGNDYIHLLNSNNDLIHSFDGVSDFEAFTISGGDWTTPNSPDGCYLAAIREDGAVQRSSHKCSEVTWSTTEGTVVSQNTDYAEVGEWVDGNPTNENRIGYFVSIDENTSGTTMIKANSVSDVRGVTVTAPAFSGNCSTDKFDSDGNLLKQYDYVAIMGLVSVIDDGTCVVNERCMPNDNGIAAPSSNNLGYQVIDRIDSSHILIAVEPSVDIIQRIRTDVAELQSNVTYKFGVENGIPYIEEL